MSHRAQRGAALLLAMVILTLVATLAAGMVWQQYRSVQVEIAERARTQAGWLLTGALDWARLLLREDNATYDSLGETWATPLAEAKLSTFLAADRDNNADADGPEAFLSGAIVDAQSRYNLRNLVVNGEVVKKELVVLRRLCASAGLPAESADNIADALRQAWNGGATGAVAPDRVADLAWLGVDAAAIERLRPSIDILPTVTPLNVNTAGSLVLQAAIGVDGGGAQRLLEARQRKAFEDASQFAEFLPPPTVPQTEGTALGVQTSYFEVLGNLRLGNLVLQERSLLRRASRNLTVLRRERVSLVADDVR
jgi:general secretion pathway protein K